jgi:hypothetical protein
MAKQRRTKKRATAKKAVRKKTAPKKAVRKKTAPKKAVRKKAVPKRGVSPRAGVAPRAAAAAGGPPGGILYKCDPAGAPGSGQCLRFNWNPRTQNWDDPPAGIPMDCSACRWFF